ncbi:MAG: M48 family metallopeptidase [Cytophagaceae bacterium]|jgi:STE24 endopeptidase|nr:M48 family metallopeptidase [Cytophagaceae bacterium]
MSAQSFLLLFIILLIADYLLNVIIDRINLANQPAQLPEDLKGIYTEESFEKSKLYLKDNTRFQWISSSFSLLLSLIVFSLGLLGPLYQWVGTLTNQPLFHFLLFFGAVFIISDLLNLPFQWYKTFVIEEKHGFNRTTPGLFIKDKLVALLMTVVIGGLLATVFFQLVKIFDVNFWWYFWLVIIVMLLLVNFLYTSVFLPLFNKLTPLEDGVLKTSILDYARKVNFPLSKVMVMDGSKRSSKANAFFSGFGKQKKIVLFDTLIQNHSVEELVAVLAHETGHFKKRHIWQNLAIGIIQTGAMLYLLSLMLYNYEVSLALGGNQHILALNLVGFAILYSPISELLGVLLHAWSRKNEFEADRYAAETYQASPLIDALKKLSEKNLSNPTPHPLYVKFHYSHPPLLERLSALRKLENNNNH